MTPIITAPPSPGDHLVDLERRFDEDAFCHRVASVQQRDRALCGADVTGRRVHTRANGPGPRCTSCGRVYCPDCERMP